VQLGRKLKGEKDRLRFAIDELKHDTRQLILITQPPQLPSGGSREAIRDDSRPPFVEDPAERYRRAESNAYLKHFQGENVFVIDIAPRFAEKDGSIRFKHFLIEE
jgi:hypothetical protein